MLMNSVLVMGDTFCIATGAVVNTYCVAADAKRVAMEMHERLQLARERAGFATAAEAARRFGWVESTYRAAENGSRPPTRTKAIVYARSFRVSPEWLLLGIGDAERGPVPVVGYVGAGAEVFAIDDGGSLDEIEPPPGIGPNAVAVIVRGNSMYPRYQEGDILIYDEHCTLAQADGEECVVSLIDGRKYVKIIRADGELLATLESWNHPPIRSVQVEWVARIKWVKRASAARF